ncbi:hypothetical protein [Maricaulis salignorans]|uniref:Uncharacterized protein n=1 Tax=Maricaulis salignorans TaxID=144026 RepID=A0A1G9WJH8_9PROT|nr:hypothetical protein [Maricaulis salignorans]SDM84599.1 hypothetical protein SAMN04488568_12532 [Maricaulis salignorans]
MAITLQSDRTDTIELDEYVDYVTRHVDPTDTDQVLASAPMLKALANNRSFLVDKFNRELQDWDTFQSSNGYSSQTLTLGSGNKFFIRANMWAPPTNPGEVWDWESKLFAYAKAHDHNFSFITVGYLGSGYGTSIHEYDPESIRGEVGEHVDLRFLEDTSLPQGKMMFYRASRDIHSQTPPEEFSISLNFMCVSREVSTREQYWFDLEQSIITGRVQNPGSTRVMFCHLAKHIGDGRTVNLLESIASGHAFPQVRVSAYDALAALESGHRARIWTRALTDSSDLVAIHARRELAQLEVAG